MDRRTVIYGSVRQTDRHTKRETGRRVEEGVRPTPDKNIAPIEGVSAARVCQLRRVSFRKHLRCEHVCVCECIPSCVRVCVSQRKMLR